jgi:hypothetical protein
MSTNPTNDSARERIQVINRASLRFHDTEISDNLMRLIAREPLGERDAKLVASRVAKHAKSGVILITLGHIALATLVVFVIIRSDVYRRPDGNSSFADSHISKMQMSKQPLFTTLSAYAAVTLFIIVRAAVNWPRHPEVYPDFHMQRTWEDTLNRYDWLRNDLRNFAPLGAKVPSERWIAQAIDEVLQEATAENASPAVEHADRSRAWQAQLQDFYELRQMFPERVARSALADWVRQLDDRDWKVRFNARLVVRSVGVAMLPALWEARSNSARDSEEDASPVPNMYRMCDLMLRDVLDDNHFEFHQYNVWICLTCGSRFNAIYKISVHYNNEKSLTRLGMSRPNYFACKNCKGTESAARAGRVVCVLDRTLEQVAAHHAITEGGELMVWERDFPARNTRSPLAQWPATIPEIPILAFSWSAVGRAFDFDTIFVGDVDDLEIEKFAAMLAADEDKSRKKALKHREVAVLYPERLSANSLNILRQLFPRFANNRSAKSPCLMAVQSLINRLPSAAVPASAGPNGPASTGMGMPREYVPVPAAPVFDVPVLDAPVLDAPVFDAPVLDAPVLDAPVLDAVVLNEPVLDEVPPHNANPPAAISLAANDRHSLGRTSIKNGGRVADRVS